jgi:4'-phosphopantetheinyl transferase
LLTIDIVPALEPERIDVWAFELTASVEQRRLCAQLLSDEELHHASRFVFERHRDAYLVAHGVLRVLISAYAHCRPRSVRWVHGPNGKPALACDQAREVSFNLSHSGTRALLAVGNGPDVGADLEQHRPIEAASIAERFFFGLEREAIHSAREPTAAFFRYWTAKEAVMKGCGAGLSLPLDHFGVLFEDDTSRRARVQVRNPAVLAADWTVETITMDDGWSAAVAARGTTWRIARQGASFGSAR